MSGLLLVLFRRVTQTRMWKAPPQNMLLCHKDYFELLILRNSRSKRSSEDGVAVPFLWGKCTFIRGLSSSEAVSFWAPGRGGRL